MKNYYKGTMSALAAACLFGTLSLLTTIGCRYGLGTYSTIALKSLIAIMILLAVVLREKQHPRLDRKTYLTVFLLAILNTVLTQTLLFTSYQDIAIGTATSLHFCYPVVVLLAGVIFCREKITGKTVICFSLIVLGVMLLYTRSYGEHTTRGSVVAILSGIVYGSYCFLLEKTRVLEKVSDARFLLMLQLVSLVYGVIVCLLKKEPLTGIPPKGLLVLLVNTVGPGLLASLFYQRGTVLVGSRTTALLGTMEPVVSIILGVAVLKETLSLRSLLGSILIILSSILMVLLKDRQAIEAPSP